MQSAPIIDHWKTFRVGTRPTELVPDHSLLPALNGLVFKC